MFSGNTSHPHTNCSFIMKGFFIQPAICTYFRFHTYVCMCIYITDFKHSLRNIVHWGRNTLYTRSCEILNKTLKLVSPSSITNMWRMSLILELMWSLLKAMRNLPFIFWCAFHKAFNYSSMLSLDPWWNKYGAKHTLGFAPNL